jgi:hypothetical protein
MTVCEQLSERMPAVALGRSRWSAAEEAHLASCADCQAEWSLVQLAGRLGASAPATVEPEAIDAKVRGRLREGRAARRMIRRWAAVGLGVAAAITLALWTGRSAPRQPVAAAPTAPLPSPAPVKAPEPSVRPPASVPAPGPLAHAQQPRLELPVPGIDEMSDADLDDLLRAVDEPLAGTKNSPNDSPGLGDPDDRALAGALTLEEG